MIKSHVPQIVILAQAQFHETNPSFETISTELKKLGVKQVFVLGPMPAWNMPLHKLILKKYWHFTPKRIANELKPDVLVTESAMKTKYLTTDSKVKYIPVLDIFCNKQGCISYLGNNKREGLVTFDASHLTPRGSIFIAKRLLKSLILEEFKQQGYQLAAK